MNKLFVEALSTQAHPIKKAKKKIRAEYITALTYIVEKTFSETNCYQAETESIISKHLHLYQNQLFADICVEGIDEKNGKHCLTTFSKPWRNKYRFMLICDVALIIFDEELVSVAMGIIKEGLAAKRQADVEQITALLKNNQDVEKRYLPASMLINQYRANKEFIAKPERRIIVTANMSAGKSTLINALIGKPIARTSQEVCTGNICCLFNKAYEDDNVHLSAQDINLSATAEDLHEYDWSGPIFIASYFAGIVPNIPHLCVIDTPGVDAALYKAHSKIAHNALLNDDYDTIIYVVSPTRLGTDAEKKHLRWVAQNLQKEKVIFVLNKLDDYHDFADSIEESIHDLKEDLLKSGFDNPIICPISAYFSYLLKMKITGQNLSEDEKDEYAVYAKKFKKPAYDLSHYYKGVKCLPSDSEEIALSKCVGLYGLEMMIYGGIL